MNSTPFIFKESLIKNRLDHFTKDEIPGFTQKFNEINRWAKSCQEGDLDKTKETSIQGTFMTRVFNLVFGYKEVVDAGEFYNQTRESKTVLDTTESDAALGFFNKTTGSQDIRVVVELKDAKTPLDKKQNRSSHLTPVEQAFQYANKNGSKCGWVIVSNFVETRLYKSNSSLEYETFDMRKMNDEKEFLRFYYFLSKDRLICADGKSAIDDLYTENEEVGAAISNDFYKKYKEIRNALYNCIKDSNPNRDELELFTKTQKLMDRFTFICFCEDSGLLPQNVFRGLVDSAHKSFSFSQTKIWDELRGLFRAIDLGNPPMKINRYNGGLFKEDPELDSLIIPDAPLEMFLQLSEYDFGSDLNVNILGQIFEHSIADVEQIKAEISGETPASKGKQKDDGIFYTPYYVTRYIVEQTVGAFLEDKKKEIRRQLFIDGPYKTEVLRPSSHRMNGFEFSRWVDVPEEKPGMSEDETLYRQAVSNLHLDYWSRYENVLRQVKICDPACGSGAFLNQCFDYLHEEMDYVLEMKRQFNAGQFTLFDVDKEILQNNLYGVDINPESVEITKLSLWLKTAKQNQTLASLDDNIKCGDSIIADSGISERAFNWKEGFPEVFKNGGFDVVAGNPPYGATLTKEQKEYLSKNYTTTEYNYDTYKTFFELGFKILKDSGYLGYITPNTFFTLELGANKLRKLLFSFTLRRIVEVFNVFPTAVVEPVITVFKKQMALDQSFTSICVPRGARLSSTFLNEGITAEFTQKDLRTNDQLIFNYRSSKEDQHLCREMEKFPRLDTMFEVMTGAKPYQVGKGTPPQTKEIVDNKPFTGDQKIDETWIPYIRGRCIDRYLNRWEEKREYIKYGEWLAEPRTASVFEGEKLFVRQTGDYLIATYDKGNVSNNTLHSIYPKEHSEHSIIFLLGLLNSSLINWYYRTVHYTEVGKPMAEVKGIFLKKIPLAITSISQKECIEAAVNKLLVLNQNRFEEKNRFIRFITNAYEPRKITEGMNTFYQRSFKEFCSEMKSQKVKLSASEQMELLPLFERSVDQIKDFSAQIDGLIRGLDEMVFDLYSIPNDDRQRIRNAVEGFN